jgi:hypothetical protein
VDDPFARIDLTVLRCAGLRVGELLDLEVGSIIDYGPTGTWLKVPLGKLATERMVPSTPPRSPPSTNGPRTAARTAARTARSRIPAPVSSPICCSPPTAAAWAPPACAISYTTPLGVALAPGRIRNKT